VLEGEEPIMRIILIFCLVLLQVGCSKKIPKGHRERVYFGGAQPAVLDPEAHNYAVDIPDVGTSNHPNFDNTGEVLWRESIGSTSRFYLVESPPIHCQGAIITMDINYCVLSRDALSGALNWKVDLGKEKTSYRLGGGISCHGDVIYVSIPHGKVVALSANSGAVLWEYSVAEPVKSAPVANNCFVFFTTISNHLICLDVRTGELVWCDVAQQGMHCIAGGAPPLILSGHVIVGHTTGELSALRQENGHVHWRNSVNTESDRLLLEDFLSWKAPIAHRDAMLYLVHPAGTLLSVDVRNGQVQWKLGAGSLYAPAFGENVLFLVDSAGYLLCVEVSQGRILWISDLPKFENPHERHKIALSWAGPVLAGGKLILAGTDGTALFVDPQNGRILERLRVSYSAMYVPPLVVNKVAYFFDQAGDVIAIR